MPRRVTGGLGLAVLATDIVEDPQLHACLLERVLSREAFSKEMPIVTSISSDTLGDSPPI